MSTRQVTDGDMERYCAMVEYWIKKSVVKNWNEATISRMSGNDEITLGNSGLTIADIRQDIRMQIVVAIQKYDPNFRTAEGKSVKESTFVYKHLWNRVGQLMKKFTDRKRGYGVWRQNLEETLFENNPDQ